MVGSDTVAHVRDLKVSEGGGLWLCGGGRLTASLVDEIDHLVVKLNPVTLGQGRPLLDGPLEPRRWRLVATRTYEDAGVVLLAYDRAVSAAGS